MGGAFEGKKKWLWIAAAALVAVLLLRSLRGGASAGGGGSSYTYGGLTSQDAVTLATAGMQQQVELANIYAATRTSLADTAARLKLGTLETHASVTQTTTMANAAEDLATIQANEVVTVDSHDNATKLAALQDESQLLKDLQPSWEYQLLNGPGAINLQNQSGALAQTSSNNFASMITSLFGGQGGSILSMFGG